MNFSLVKWTSHSNVICQLKNRLYLTVYEPNDFTPAILDYYINATNSYFLAIIDTTFIDQLPIHNTRRFDVAYCIDYFPRFKSTVLWTNKCCIYLVWSWIKRYRFESNFGPDKRDILWFCVHCSMFFFFLQFSFSLRIKWQCNFTPFYESSLYVTIPLKRSMLLHHT